ncbi:ribonuclease H [Senna tora]|uniref:Ribonuclease H n=1 Tax=Senna tora TaxID=362788 RepID=A0A834T6J1_9FABA|nr:ribonuclease H [Senna tora]
MRKLLGHNLVNYAASSKGLQMLWIHGFRKVDVETDSHIAINLITHGVIPTHSYTYLVFAIKELWARDWDIRCMHVHREANYNVADSFAKMDHSCLKEGQIFMEPLTSCGNYLVHDVNELEIPNLVVA